VCARAHSIFAALHTVKELQECLSAESTGSPKLLQKLLDRGECMLLSYTTL